jgi:tetratricopeptide (TPR) repeat protein
VQRLALSALALALSAACAGSPPPPAEPPPPATNRPPRRPGVGPGAKPGQAELEAAIAAAKANDLDTAIQRAHDAIAKNPSLEHAYLLLGSSCGMKEDLACERAAYERGLEAIPRSAPLRKELGLLLLQQGEVDAAVKRYEEANELSGGQTPEYMADLGYAYVYAGRLAEAVDLSTRALQLDARCFTCAMTLGQAKLTSRDFPGAVSAYRAARDIDPQSEDAQLGLAKAHFLAGQLEPAGDLYEAMVKASPDDGRLRVQAAQVAMAAKRYEDAVAHLQVVAAANPDEKPLLQLLLEAQTKAKDTQGAAATKARLKKLK